MIFYITFGQKYRYQDHEKWINTKTMYAHPDGYWQVRAKDEDEARVKVWKALEQYWSHMYRLEPAREMFPLGIIGIID